MSKKIALTNMDIVWEDKEANKFQCEEMIKEAADEHADIILFPEMTLTGFSLRVKEMADYHEETIAYFSALAAKYSIMIGFGYITMPDEFGRNHFCFVDENGSVLADYEKIHPFTHGGETRAVKSVIFPWTKCTLVWQSATICVFLKCFSRCRLTQMLSF